jgi:two-component system, LytTR family, sensor kinase
VWVKIETRYWMLAALTVAIWLGWFVSATVGTAFDSLVSAEMLARAQRRAVLCTAGVLSTFPMYWLLAKLANRSALIRFGASALLALVGATLYGELLWLAYYGLNSPSFDGGMSHFATVLVALTNHFWVYVACLVAFWAVHYSFALESERERLAKAQALALEAQNRMLRYQINPHFLFNALNALSTLILDQRNRDAERMVVSLSSFLRRSIGKDPALKVSLSEELEAAREYLSIEQIRFGERLAVREKISAEALDVMIPSLLLQPLLENAVKHGLAGGQGALEIRVEAEVQGPELKLRVKDNGRPAGQPAKGVGLGLENVRRRLETLYGAAAKARWGPALDGGFEVSLSFPGDRP